MAFRDVKREDGIIILQKLLAINDKIFTSLRKAFAHYEMPCKIIVLSEMPHNERW